jgi:hypothetical protein
VKGGDVLERNQDVPVQLDVNDVLDVTVGGEDALLVLAAEESDLDLLALVLARVVLDASERSRIGSTERVVPAAVAKGFLRCGKPARGSAPAPMPVVSRFSIVAS